MNISLEGKVIIVTGSTQGVGEATARIAAESGAAAVMITGRDAGRGGAVADEIAASGVKTSFVAADLADADAPEAIVSACIERFGRVDALVNAAALTDRASLLTGAREFWDRMFAVNARAPFFLMQQCVEAGTRAEGVLPGGLKVRRRARALHRQLTELTGHAGAPEPVDWVTVYALAVNEENAAGGRVVTAPTNGAAGIIPAVLYYYRDFVPGADEDGIVRFLLVAAGIGTLFKENASISGAEVAWARAAVETTTRSTHHPSTCRTSTGSVRRPRLFSIRSWSAREGSDQSDFAWRSRCSGPMASRCYNDPRAP